MIDPEYNDIAAVLIGYQQKPARRIYAEVAGCFAHDRLVTCKGKPAIPGVYTEYGNGIG